jgi:hypothetical protein
MDWFLRAAEQGVVMELLPDLLVYQRMHESNLSVEFGTRAYTDIAEMLGAEQPDLVSVCLPNEAHFEPTLQLIRAGVALLVEKPLVFDLTEADTLLREAEARSLFFAINLNRIGYAGMHDPVGAVVFGQPANVDYTVVGGKFIVKEGQLVTVDEQKLIEKHNKAAKRLLQG